MKDIRGLAGKKINSDKAIEAMLDADTLEQFETDFEQASRKLLEGLITKVVYC